MVKALHAALGSHKEDAEKSSITPARVKEILKAASAVFKRIDKWLEPKEVGLLASFFFVFF